ncbi:hypothetical protein ACROYT_G027937 [Oculina patagonica]
MRRLLQKGITPDYLSCVSGGGYTGTAYLDWKYRNEQKDDPKWHKEFFDHMCRRAGMVCNWQNPLEGFLDTIMILSLMIFVAIILPCFIWFGFAFPTAYIIDYFFGDLLRYPFTCPDAKTHNFTSAEKAQNTEVSKLFNMTNQIECVPTLAPEMYFTFMTFAFLFIMFLLFFVITKVAGPSLKPFAICLFNLTGFVFAMVFLPWFIEEYVVVTPMWLNALILVLSIFLWLGIPPLRDKASLAMIVYLYAYVVKWRVYKTAVLSVEFSDARFNVLMWISGILIWANPFLGVFQRNALGAYQRWCIVHIYHARFIRELLEVVNVGPTPPAVLHLSDGGHVENLGILPLLKKRLQRIVVIDGGTLKEDQGVAGALINALEKARDTLHCSFIGMSGRDVLEDLRANFIDRPSSKQPRSYRFRVEYYDYTGEGDEHMVGEGEVLYILPRHPKQGLLAERKSWGEVTGDVKTDIEADLWGSGPEVEAKEVERLTCCCCECCHRYPLKFLSGFLCGAFPYHSTANQFFTPAMFTAYHREGFRAGMEARAVEFLLGSDNNSE